MRLIVFPSVGRMGRGLGGGDCVARGAGETEGVEVSVGMEGGGETIVVYCF